MQTLWYEIDPKNTGQIKERIFKNLMGNRMAPKKIKSTYKTLVEVSKEVKAGNGISLDLLAVNMLNYAIERNSSSREKALHYAIQVTKTKNI